MPEENFVTLTIDGQEVKVPKGTNLIEAARQVGIEIPHYCYHRHLSIAGNCRMCQVEVQGAPKLCIGCNTGASEGMVVKTHETSEQVAEAQRATLEFLLINHPLDCTVCDQAGHCKLQDYYFQYNSHPSRFVEDKVEKVKAEPLGPQVIYDGERCIVCTRCVRFCEEVTKTRELGVFNRGDKSVIGIYPGEELANPFSGTVVDLCPVGALTHRSWRFNSRIWYTKATKTICPGCSTGCNVEVFSRDGVFIQVKARLNSEVNQEWLCDEGRYGFSRFQSEARLATPLVVQGGRQVVSSWEDALQECRGLVCDDEEEGLLVLSPFLTTEEMWLALKFARKFMKLEPGSSRVAVAYVPRVLSEMEQILVSPDFAPNARAAEVLGIVSTGEGWRDESARKYRTALDLIGQGKVKKAMFVGDFSLALGATLEIPHQALAEIPFALSIMSRGPESPVARLGAKNPATLSSEGSSGDNSQAAPVAETGRIVEESFHFFSKVVFPGMSINEKSGVIVNQARRAQRVNRLLQAPLGSQPDWVILQKIARYLLSSVSDKTVVTETCDCFNVQEERGLYRLMSMSVPAFTEISLAKIGENGCVLLPGSTRESST